MKRSLQDGSDMYSHQSKRPDLRTDNPDDNQNEISNPNGQLKDIIIQSVSQVNSDEVRKALTTLAFNIPLSWYDRIEKNFSKGMAN